MSNGLLTEGTDDPNVPIQLLIYAVQTAVTTATCIADYLSWSNFSNAEKIELGKLYVPYLALCTSIYGALAIPISVEECADLLVAVFMGVDMWARLSAAISRSPGTSSKKTN